MPTYHVNRVQEQSCWKNRSKLKTFLTVLIPVALIILIVLLAVFLKKSGVCETKDCIEWADEVKAGIDASVNPCDDFYKFVCGNKLKNTRKPYAGVYKKPTVNLLKLYREPEKANEHRMIKQAKRVFKACMDEEAVEKNGLAAIARAIEEIGGWPMLKSHSEEIRFDWVEATYKLRQLGYPFASIIDVGVKRLLNDSENFHLTVDTGKGMEDAIYLYKYTEEEASSIITNLTRFFTDVPISSISEDVEELYRFHWNYQIYSDTKMMTIDNFQNAFDATATVPFDWLKFLNTITGPKVQVSASDHVLFLEPSSLAKAFNLIQTTSNRTIGNYMVWKLISSQIPYLPKKVQSLVEFKIDTRREDFCVHEIDKRSIPSPIDVLNARELLTDKIKLEAQEMFSESKVKLIDVIKRTNWTTDEDKTVMVDAIKTVSLIIGLPNEYLEDKIFDRMDIDLIDPQSEMLTDLLAQANRNHQTVLYQQITIPASTNIMSRYYLKHKGLYLQYSRPEKELFLPTELAYLSHMNVPMYGKYPFAVTHLLQLVFGIFSHYDFEFESIDGRMSKRVENATKDLQKCVAKQLQKYNQTDLGAEIQFGLTSGMNDKLSYEMYDKWVSDHGEEPKLPGLNYTQRQLFWILGTHCHVPNYEESEFDKRAYTLFGNGTLISKMNNPYFGKDFMCPEGSASNPANKCPNLV